MKIEVEKLVRDRWGRFYTVEKIYGEFIGVKENSKPLYLTNIIKVANTPMELIQVGDLVELNNKLSVVNGVGMGNGGTTDFVIFNKDGITKILTPNSSGGYDLQYSKEEK